MWSVSSIDIEFTKCPLTLLAGVGNEFVVLTVGCCDAWVDIGADEGGEPRFVGWVVAW